MKRSIGVLVLLLISTIVIAQPNTWDKDIEEITSVTEDILEIISGEPGDDYDWERFRSHFMSNGNLTAIFPDTSDGYSIHEGMIDDWIQRAGPYYESVEFYEEAIETDVRTTGRIANVWQHFRIYDSEGTTVDEGINAYHMVKDGDHWKIAHLMWDVNG